MYFCLFDFIYIFISFFLISFFLILPPPSPFRSDAHLLFKESANRLDYKYGKLETIRHLNFECTFLRTSSLYRTNTNILLYSKQNKTVSNKHEKHSFNSLMKLKSLTINNLRYTPISYKRFLQYHYHYFVIYKNIYQVMLLDHMMYDSVINTN